MKRLMFFVAAATMLFAVSCNKDDESSSSATAGDNQMIYNGKTYQGEATGAINDNNANLTCSDEKDGVIFIVDCHIQNPSNYTYDLTQEDPDHMIHFHINIEGPAVLPEDRLDLQYQNAPHLWYFLNGDNVSNTSAFTSGTAVTTLDENTITLTVNGTLVNGKPISFRIVVPRD